jgi:hypothetical protein
MEIKSGYVRPLRLLLAAAGLSIMLLLGYGYVPERSPAPAANTRAESAGPVQPVMPKGYRPEAVVRDPFAPGETAALPPAADTGGRVAANAQAKSAAAKRKTPELGVRGIIRSGDRLAVIVEYNGESRMVAARGVVGDYRLVGSDGKTATFIDGDGVPLTVKPKR